MSDRVEERRAEAAQLQKKQQDMRTAKERAAAGEKFKLAFAQKVVVAQKSAADNHKKQSEKQSSEKKGSEKKSGEATQQQKSGGALLARQGIAGRSMAERMVKGRSEASHQDESISSKREKDLRQVDADSRETKSGGDEPVSRKQFDSAVEQRKDDRQQSKEQGQSQGHGGQQSMSGQGGGQGQSGQQQQERDRGAAAGEIGGVKAAPSKAAGIGVAAGSSNAGKVIIGRSDKAAATERISTQVMQSIVDKVYQGSQEGMQDFIVQLKDDALGGGSLRVTLKDGKLKITFTMKEASAKNLLESSKGVLQRMFERKGLALESFEVKVRGEA